MRYTSLSYEGKRRVALMAALVLTLPVLLVDSQLTRGVLLAMIVIGWLTWIALLRSERGN